MRNKLMLGAASLAVLTAFAAPATAQTVDEIIVTAQKREQSLQDVPVVVTSVNAQQLQDAGIKDIKDLTVLTPGLLVTSTSNETVTTARIRGIGTVGDNPGLESSVGVVIDGVYRPRNGVGFGDLGQIERIEVLKGPQGTLFGKNTSAGVINIISQGPSFDFEADAELTYGNFGALGVAGSVNGTLIEDKLAGRLYAVRRLRDGFYDVRTGKGPRTEDQDADQDFYSVRGQLLYTPTTDFEMRVIADYTKRDENCCAGVAVLRAAGRQGYIDTLAGGQGLVNPPTPFSRVVHSNRGTSQDIEDRGVSFDATWQTPWLGGAALTSITAWRQFDLVSAQDSDFSGADIWYRPSDGRNFTTFEQVSQEFRLAGETEKLNWLVGLFATKEDLSVGNTILYGSDYRPYFGLVLSGGASTSLSLPSSYFAAGTGQSDRYEQEAKGMALFTNNSYKVTDAFELTVGLRYTSEEKTLDAHYRNTVTGNTCLVQALCTTWADTNFDNAVTAQNREEKEWTGTLQAAYRFNPSVMSYLSYARGYKAGGFNLDRSRTATATPTVSPYYTLKTDTSFEAEFVDSYELGVKSTLLDRTLLLNASAFYQDYEGFQLNAFTGINFIVTSIPEVVSKGVDADFLWFTPLDGLTLQGGVTYADTKYGDFVAPTGASLLLPNNRVSFAPLWSGSLSFAYERELESGLLIRTSINSKYTSKYNTGSDLNPLKEQGDLTVFNGRITFSSADERYSAELWGQNLTDEDYYQVVFDAPLQNSTSSTPGALPTTNALGAYLGAPRTYGVTLRAKF